MKKKKGVAWDIFEDKMLKITPPSQYLSFGDLKRIPEFIVALMRQDSKEFERILYENGVDITKGYNVTNSMHRMRTSNLVYEGFRVDFTERTDKEWLSTGCASLEALQQGLGGRDYSMVQELKKLDPRGYKNNSVDEDFYD